MAPRKEGENFRNIQKHQVRVDARKRGMRGQRIKKGSKEEGQVISLRGRRMEERGGRGDGI